MKKTSLWCAFQILLTTCIYAQKNYLPGQVILDNGDTVKGFVDYRNWERNPRTVSFKAGERSMEETFLPIQLKSFQIYQQDTYISAIVNKDMRPVTINPDFNQAIMDNSDVVRDTVFLRLLTDGDNLALYELVDKKNHFFIKPNNGNFEELQYRLVVNDDHRTFMTYNTFRDQLKRFINSSGNEVNRMIGKSDYNSHDLKEVVKAMNGSKDEYGVNNSTREKRRFFAGAGTDFNALSFGVDNQGLDALITDNHFGYHLVLGMNVFNERNFQRLFLRMQLAYSSWKYKASGERTEYAIQFKKRYEYHVQMKTISPSVIVGYRLMRSHNLKPYFAGSIKFNISSYPDNVYTKSNLTTGETEKINNFIDFQKTWIEIGPVVGITFRQFDFNFYKHALGTNVNYVSWKANYGSNSFTIAYLF